MYSLCRIDNLAVNDCCLDVYPAERFSREARQVVVEDNHIRTHAGGDAAGLLFLKPDPGSCLGEQTNRLKTGQAFGGD